MVDFTGGMAYVAILCSGSTLAKTLPDFDICGCKLISWTGSFRTETNVKHPNMVSVINNNISKCYYHHNFKEKLEDTIRLIRSQKSKIP